MAFETFIKNNKTEAKRRALNFLSQVSLKRICCHILKKFETSYFNFNLFLQKTKLNFKTKLIENKERIS